MSSPPARGTRTLHTRNCKKAPALLTWQAAPARARRAQHLAQRAKNADVSTRAASLMRLSARASLERCADPLDAGTLRFSFPARWAKGGTHDAQR